MRCTKVIQELSNYLEGNIDESLKQELCAHLSKCNHCQVVYDTTKKTIELYCDGELYPLPTGVRDRLHAFIRQKCQTQAK